MCLLKPWESLKSREASARPAENLLYSHWCISWTGGQDLRSLTVSVKICQSSDSFHFQNGFKVKSLQNNFFIISLKF